MPRLRRKGHQKRPGALDNAATVGEMETAIAAATLLELTEFFDRIEAGENVYASKWMPLIARKRIRDELLHRLKLWCTGAPLSVTDAEIAAAAAAHRLGVDFSPSRFYEDASGRTISRNALESAKHLDAELARRAARQWPATIRNGTHGPLKPEKVSGVVEMRTGSVATAEGGEGKK